MSNKEAVVTMVKATALRHFFSGIDQNMTAVDAAKMLDDTMDFMTSVNDFETGIQYMDYLLMSGNTERKDIARTVWQPHEYETISELYGNLRNMVRDSIYTAYSVGLINRREYEEADNENF